ncbi:hypothetical protein RCL_jg18997.t1 [Rhizophagus clarus]|uniref:HAT C-terminal dimerisation domain-containing protein n=1 Tax=Rhizophagus clarus TaxID=94130 RepID=A0A8H3QX76_9GLOM|nr:hypothetical protein RCL_jg18997.t1 [Rhizophagus clarus]
MTNTTLKSTDQAPNDSNPFKQTAAIIKPQTKFLLDDGEKCSKNYKYDGSTGNLMQKEIGYEEPLHLIQDISTRWNSSYLAWDQLIFLQYAVLQLNLTNSLKPSDNSYEVLEDSDNNTINSDIVEEESSQIEVDYTDEITTYFLLPVARENKNPLDWWKSKQEIFPVLSIIA